MDEIQGWSKWYEYDDAAPIDEDTRIGWAHETFGSMSRCQATFLRSGDSMVVRFIFEDGREELLDCAVRRTAYKRESNE